MFSISEVFFKDHVGQFGSSGGKDIGLSDEEVNKRTMNFHSILLLLLLLSFASADILPDLPRLPPRSPKPSPTQLPPTAGPQPPPSGPGGALSSLFPTITPSATATRAPSLLPPSKDPVGTGADNGKCQRDLSKRRPKLGKSQRRYAIVVLISALAVAVASILYNSVYTWMPKKRLVTWRFMSIIIARLLTLVAIKLSAALVDSITKALPNDGALDASGAFLTWGSAIFMRLYNEGLIMTTTVLSLIYTETAWNDKLRMFLSEVDKSSLRGDRAQANHAPALMTHSADAVIADNVAENTHERVPAWIRLVAHRWERSLLVVLAVVYTLAEIAVLVTNLLSLIGSLEQTDPEIFAPDEEKAQCPINGDDIRALIILGFLQCLYAVTHQPSLIPLLTVFSIRPRVSLKREKKQNWLLLLTLLVLLAWAASLLCLPVMEGTMDTLFITGDLSLFWFVMVSPPAYTTTSYIIRAIHACLSVTVGIVLIFRIAQSHRRKNTRETQTRPYS